jgi:hypothetical protein
VAQMRGGHIDDGPYILDMIRRHPAVMRRIMSSVYFGLHKCHGQLHMVIASMLLGLQQLHCNSSANETSME